MILVDDYGAGFPIQRSLVQNHWMALTSRQLFIYLMPIKCVPGIPVNLVVKVSCSLRGGSVEPCL